MSRSLCILRVLCASVVETHENHSTETQRTWSLHRDFEIGHYAIPEKLT